MKEPLDVEKLRKEAFDLKKAKGIQHAKALDEVANAYGFDKWVDLIAAQNQQERSEKRRLRSPYGLRRGRSDEQPPEGAHLSPYENPTYVKRIFRP